MNDLIIVIFGATGDLTSRKLLPAISRLYVEKQIPEKTKVIALGRRSYTNEEYLNVMNEAVKLSLDLKTLENLVSYFQIEITKREEYPSLVETLRGMKHENTRELYYLAIGPELFPVVAENINLSHLVTQGNMQQSIIFEKPFGHDLTSAKMTNEMLWQYFDEKQIYRIDHYLGKEMIQNIMMVRFANRIFEDSWHNRTIKNR
ncbi:MAG TPA: hypothetical protein P5091_05395, partial [Acholeplasmataceae bacterium]|nr:hypothetical protein [Acholeplasmataceae bacterium]